MWAYIEVSIPDDIDRIERGELFEEPIVKMLKEARIDYVWMGSSAGLRDGEYQTLIGYDVNDLKRAVLILVKILRDAEVSANTTIRVDLPRETTYRLGDMA